MDSDQQTSFAKQQDPELAARIVRTIGQLEADYLFASGPLSERFIREVTSVMRSAAPDSWQIVGNEWSASLTCPDWRATRGVGRGDAWLELGDVVEDENEHTWIAVAVSAGPTKLCLELKFRNGLEPIAKALTAKDKPVANVLKEGFERDETTKRILIPISIEADSLARGFELNDLDEALAPLRRAVEAAIKAKPDLDALITHVREQTKRK